MTKFAFPLFVTLVLQLANNAMAQNNKPLKQGRVVFEQTIKGGKATINVNGTPQSFDRPDRTMKWELLFTADQTLRRPMDTEDRPEAEMAAPAGAPMGGNIRVMNFAMPESTIWHNFTTGIKVDQREAGGKKYLVTDSIQKHTWKLTGETKTILGYTCQKAITQTPVKAYNMQMQDGEFKRTERWDTVNVTAWFAPAITVPGGPEFQGELPGMILEYESRNGTTLIKAVEITEDVKTSDIREPKTGKKISKEAFDKEVDAQQKEMLERMRSSRRASF